jgi:hypothetical protein
MDKDSALFPSIPTSTIRAARALYGRGNLYLRLGDRLNHLVSKLDRGMFAAQLSNNRTALLAVLTIIQYVESLTDVEMAQAVQLRMDLRYALHLATPSPRLDPHSLCSFRRWILTDAQCRCLFEEIFRIVYPEISSTAMKEEPNIEDVLNSICENVVRASLIDAMLHSMEALSAKHFNWLRRITLPHWYQRYNSSVSVGRSELFVRKQELAREDVWGDIQHLLYEVQESNSPDIMELREIQDLKQIWEQLTDSKSVKDCNHCINQIH